MDFKDLLDCCRAQAICNTFIHTEESVYRSICRAYSERFHTPLAQVYSLDPEHVMTEHFSGQLDDLDIDENLDSILEQVCILEDPEYEANQEKELQEWIEDSEMEEEERIKNGISVFKFNERKSKEPKLMDEKTPTGGSVDFSGLNEKKEN